MNVPQPPAAPGRRQLALAARIRELLDQGHTLAAAQRIVPWKTTWPLSAP